MKYLPQGYLIAIIVCNGEPGMLNIDEDGLMYRANVHFPPSDGNPEGRRELDGWHPTADEATEQAIEWIKDHLRHSR
jgi:hypothetical protein